MDEPANLEEAFEQGINARAQGRGQADNPFDVQTPEHREWAAGWAATLDLDEDDDPESTRVKPGKTDKDAKPDSNGDPLSG